MHMLLSNNKQGPGGSMSWVVGLPNNSYKPITNTACLRTWLCNFINYKKRVHSTRSRKLFAHGRWFSPGTPASITTKTYTGHHDIAEIGIKHQKSINQSNNKLVLNTKPSNFFYSSLINIL